MPIVSNTEETLGGGAQSGALVRVRLVDDVTGLIVAAHAGPGGVSAGGDLSMRADLSGEWSATLAANDLITPAGTRYIVDVRPRVGYPYRHSFVVPDGPGPYTVAELVSGEVDPDPSGNALVTDTGDTLVTDTGDRLVLVLA